MDLKIDKKGKEVGQGKLIYAAKVKIDKKGNWRSSTSGWNHQPPER